MTSSIKFLSIAFRMFGIYSITIYSSYFMADFFMTVVEGTLDIVSLKISSLHVVCMCLWSESDQKSNPATHIMPNTAVKNGGFRGNRAFSLPGTEIRGGYFFSSRVPCSAGWMDLGSSTKNRNLLWGERTFVSEIKAPCWGWCCIFSPPWTRKKGKREPAFFLLHSQSILLNIYF